MVDLTQACFYLPFPSLVFVRVKQVGPWQLDGVKARLRAEQVGRERAASARYRTQEWRDLGEDNKGKTSWAHCILLLLLLLLVLVLSSVVVALAKK